MGNGAVGGYNSSLTHFLLWALLWHPAGNHTADLHAYVTKLLAVSSLGRGFIGRDANMSWPRIESCFWIFLSGLRHHGDLSGAWGGDSFCHTLLRSAVSCFLLQPWLMKSYFQEPDDTVITVALMHACSQNPSNKGWKWSFWEACIEMCSLADRVTCPEALWCCVRWAC